MDPVRGFRCLGEAVGVRFLWGGSIWENLQKKWKIRGFPWENSLVKLPEGKPFKNWDSNGIWMGISCDFLGLH